MSKKQYFNITANDIKAIWSRYRVIPHNPLEAERWVKRLKDAEPALAEELLNEFDQRYVGNGVAYVRNPKGDSIQSKQGVSYVNLGEAYTPTLCYFHKWQVFMSVSWGDALEMMENSTDDE